MQNNVRAILLDIEGTTTPVAFVYEVLFGFARRNLLQFIQQRHSSQDVLADIAALRVEHRDDLETGRQPPAWRDDSAKARLESVIRYVCWLMDEDRKSPALKSLQGKIWKAGYISGELRAEVYPDVPHAFSRWAKQGRRIHIYSSGSVLAQKLLFAHTTAGDLTGYLDGYFDTATGGKRDTASYRSISRQIALSASEVLFVSDVIAELDAARDAGMMTMLCVRPESCEGKRSAHPIIRNFDVIFPR